MYESGDLYRYLDSSAARLLSEARACYARHALDTTSIVQAGDETVLFLCRGDRITGTLAVQLAAAGLGATVSGPAITIADQPEAAVRAVLKSLMDQGPADALALAGSAANKASAKYDWAIGDELLCIDYAARALDVRGAHTAAAQVLASSSRTA